MAATREDIRQWLIKARQKDATHLIIACDTFDYTDYPVHVLPNQHVQEEIEKLQSSPMQKIMEVYDLTLPLETQLNQKRVWNI